MAADSILLASLVAVAYVGIIYAVSYLACPHSWQDRDHPSVIKARIVAVLFMAMAVRILIRSRPGSVSISEVGWTLLLLAPLVYVKVCAQMERLPREITGKGSLSPLFMVMRAQWATACEMVREKDLEVIRNVLVGPFAEERVFRQTLFAILPAAQFRVWSALIFASAHAHGLLLGEAIEGVLVQFLFTLVFGYYVGGVYMQSRSVITCFAVHSLCNLVGFPDPDDFFKLSRRRRIVAGVWLLVASLLYALSL